MKRDTNDDLTYDPNYKGGRKIAEDGTGTLLWIESVIPNETVIMHCRPKLEPIKHQARFGFTVKGYRG